MSGYTPVYKKQYMDGFINAPPYQTPITAEVMNAYEDAISNIESYLSENPYETPSSGGGTAVDLSNGTLDIIICNLTARGSMSQGRKIGTTIGIQSVAVGFDVTASSYYSHAEGEGTESSGEAAHAEGRNTKASRQYAHAEGNSTNAGGYAAHAEGSNCKASGDKAHAEGEGTNAGGYAAHAEGGNCEASGDYSHAEGNSTNAGGYAAHAEGGSTKALGQYSHAEGRLSENS